jgi:hypothetical protein
MEKIPPSRPSKGAFDPLGRAKHLAEKMARALDNEDVADVSIALALVTSGIIRQYADNAEGAYELIQNIRRLEDQFIAKVFKANDPCLH